MIQFRCACGRLLQARDEVAGGEAQCPVCGKMVPVPSYSDTPPRRPEIAEGPAPRRRGEDERHQPKPSGGIGVVALVLICVVGLLCLGGVGVGLLLPAVQKVRTAAARMQESNNLKQIGIAFHNFASAHGGADLPCAAAYRSKDGKPLLSWRVAMLPYIEQEPLFRQFKLDEPWDGPNNIKLLGLMPKTYARPSVPPSSDGLTHYLAVTGRGTAFDEGFKGARTVQGTTLRLGLTLVDITDGTSNTMGVVVAAQGVPWTKPEELDVDAGPIGPRLDTSYGGTAVMMMDASVRMVTARDEARWRALASAAANDPPGQD